MGELGRKCRHPFSEWLQNGPRQSLRTYLSRPTPTALMPFEACTTVVVRQGSCYFASKRHERRRLLEPLKGQPLLGTVLATAGVDHPLTGDNLLVEAYPGHATCLLTQFTNRYSTTYANPLERGVRLQQTLEAMTVDMESQPRATFVFTERLKFVQNSNSRKSCKAGVTKSVSRS